MRAGVAAHVGAKGVADLVDVAGATLPFTAGEHVGAEAGFEAAHRGLGLGLEGGIEENQFPTGQHELHQ